MDADQLIATPIEAWVDEPLDWTAFGIWLTMLLQARGDLTVGDNQPYMMDGTDYTVPGDIRFRDVNGDGVINSDDRDVVGNPWPDFQGGLTNTMSFRGLDLTVFMQFTQGNDIFNGEGNL